VEFNCSRILETLFVVFSVYTRSDFIIAVSLMIHLFWDVKP